LLIKSINHLKSYVTVDKSLIREILHPLNDPVNIGYSLAHATLKKGEETSPHTLKESSEVYIILKGSGVMHIDDESESVFEGDVIMIPQNSVQHIRNSGKSDLLFLCIVEPYWQKKNDLVL